MTSENRAKGRQEDAERSRTSGGGPAWAYRCPLCGRRFTAEEAQTCRISCPLAKGCKLVQCPNCRYEFPPG